MKPTITLALLLVLVTTAFSQQLAVSKFAVSQTDYLQKSKQQKKTALIFLLGGGGFIATAAIIPKGEQIYDGICIGAYCSDKYKNDGIKGTLLIAGCVAALSSIPFFIASGKNKKKANASSFFIDMENLPALKLASIKNQSFPVLGLRINL